LVVVPDLGRSRFSEDELRLVSGVFHDASAAAEWGSKVRTREAIEVPEPTTPEEQEEVKKLVVEAIKELPAKQIERVAGLDDKVLRIVQVAGVVIGLAGLSSSKPTGGPDVGGLPLVVWLLIGALIAFVVAAIVALVHLRPRRLNFAVDTARFWDDVYYKSESEARLTLIDSIEKAYKHNDEEIDRKALTVRLALYATFAEILLVGAAIIVARIPGS
jgi:hypothetical protein